MALNTKQFGTILKKSRMDKRLTQPELAEELDISLSYLKDLEGSKNMPSLEVFARAMQFFNLSADAVIYPNSNKADNTYQKIQRLLTRLSENQLKVILATAEALVSAGGKNPK